MLLGSSIFGYLGKTYVTVDKLRYWIGPKAYLSSEELLALKSGGKFNPESERIIASVNNEHYYSIDSFNGLKNFLRKNGNQAIKAVIVTKKVAEEMGKRFKEPVILDDCYHQFGEQKDDCCNIKCSIM